MRPDGALHRSSLRSTGLLFPLPLTVCLPTDLSHRQVDSRSSRIVLFGYLSFGGVAEDHLVFFGGSFAATGEELFCTVCAHIIYFKEWLDVDNDDVLGC